MQMHAIAAETPGSRKPKHASYLLVTYDKKLAFAHSCDRNLQITYRKDNTTVIISSWGHNMAGIALMMAREETVESFVKKDTVLVMWILDNTSHDRVQD